jgi:hypothetical protein
LSFAIDAGQVAIDAAAFIEILSEAERCVGRRALAPAGGFEPYLSAARMKKEVPVSIVSTKEMADFEITGTRSRKNPGGRKRS